jgi:hypothetical protein
MNALLVFDTSALGGIILIILGIAFYILPAIIGFNKKGSTGIVLLTIFLGWTVVGWLAALIWAASAPVYIAPKFYICSKCGYRHSLTQTVKLWVCPNCKSEQIV